ncbi:UDP-N-acetylenolpyruvoylglucosamine reductase [Woeseia oceani]|uniref:UDP-N-acetylenolpyruvoylglucosamine reductase n=2 Tax=Woeseia oceani TaxID=1548547 RepID=A0A193LLC6_9GAMM|nr:UDP-N-acetylenolpyruvoylglucosamine reductase [Woeseia oceani]
MNSTSAFAGELRRNEPMSKHTSLRVGGPADLFYKPASLEDLAVFLQSLDSDTPVFWFGLGSNLLVRDGGLRGAVIATAGIFKDIERHDDDSVVAGASLPCTLLARQCIRWGLGPSEFFAGIPGTVGGALAMNAGAHGGETWERVRSVRTIDRAGNVRVRTPDDYSVGYRSVKGPADEWFVEGTFVFDSSVVPSMEAMKGMLDKRKETQPLGLPSCGSVFRNPVGDHSARLIEASGLKGYRIGGAEVSDKHANFIINRDDATAADIEAVITHVRNTVREQHGIELICEVRIVGEVLS